jgi:hypothetical protein
MATKAKTIKIAKGTSPKATKKAKAKAAKPAAGKMSQMAAAERVLAEAGEPLNCKQMVEAMAAKGYWQ